MKYIISIEKRNLSLSRENRDRETTAKEISKKNRIPLGIDSIFDLYLVSGSIS